jgi:hypothetical protein
LNLDPRLQRCSQNSVAWQGFPHPCRQTADFFSPWEPPLCEGRFHISKVYSRICHGDAWYSGWWFGTFFIFPYIGNNPNWLIFFRGVETTNQYLIAYTRMSIMVLFSVSLSASSVMNMKSGYW